jgi:hypothetical protein
MKEKTLILLLLILSNFCFSQPVKLIKQIPINESALYQSASFVVLEDGIYLFTDARDKNNQIKIFNEQGELVKAWGKMGPGPEEFGGLGFPDYQSPLLAVSDAGKHQIHIFEIIKDFEFKKIGTILAWEQNGNIKIYDKNIIISGIIISPNGKKYLLFKRDFHGRKTDFILPVEYSYGRLSKSEHEKIKNEVSGISLLSFLDVCGDTAFYVSDVRLKIAKIDLKTNMIEFFGQEPDNFRPVVMNQKAREALLKNPQVYEEILTQHSFVAGIFSDSKIVGLIYINREKKIGDSLYFVPYIQIYDHSGKLRYQQSLSPFYTEERIIPLYYQKDKSFLYLCSIIYGLEATRYTIYKYQIGP